MEKEMDRMVRPFFVRFSVTITDSVVTTFVSGWNVWCLSRLVVLSFQRHRILDSLRAFAVHLTGDRGRLGEYPKSSL
jgi:hypothetical protein